jgi:sterol desaturase/sphingolipid hydroxylase (fatty acid hydroxylase superfamily)
VPSLVEVLLSPASWVVFGLYAALILWEAIAPARKLPAIRAWRFRGLVAFAAYFLVSTYLPYLWSEQFARFQLLDLTGLGTWGGALAGLFTYEAGAYLWHRSMHGTDALWRSFHQMHHSAERFDTFGAFWFSPLDMAGWTTLASVCLTLVIGITPEAAMIVLYAITFCGIFQHANVRTPRWLGYFIQRPESHSYHHERGVHGRNYADLPVFDLLFGTFHNPAGFAAENGFYEGASSRIGEMLLMRDVSRPA